MALLRTYRRFLEILGWCELGLAVVLLFGIVASIGAQVVSRYFFNNPLIWVEEAVVYGFIWLVFLGASVGLKTQRHIRIEWLSHIWGGRWAAGLYLIRQGVVIAIVVLVFPYALVVMNTESRSATIALPWELPRFLFFSLPISISFVLLAMTAFYFLLAGLRALPHGAAVEAILCLGDDDFHDVEKLMESE